MIDFTGYGTGNSRHAAELLVFSKSTRLEMRPGLMEDIKAWSDQQVDDELAYMARTIPSSWEFVHYTMLIEGASRAFTHQLVRSRTFSFAQQTMRVLNVKGWDYLTGPSILENEGALTEYQDQMTDIGLSYDRLIQLGAKIEDARGILPTNILTNILIGGSMRSWSDLMRKRASSRTQDEYHTFLELAKEQVLKVHPWMHHFLDRQIDHTLAELEELIVSLPNRSSGAIDKKLSIDMVKLLDEIRKELTT